MCRICAGCGYPKRSRTLSGGWGSIGAWRQLQCGHAVCGITPVVALERVLWPLSGGHRGRFCAVEATLLQPRRVRESRLLWFGTVEYPLSGGCRTAPGIGGNSDTATSCAGITPVVAPGCGLSSPSGDDCRTLSSGGNSRAATLMRESRFAPIVASDAFRSSSGDTVSPLPGVILRCCHALSGSRPSCGLCSDCASLGRYGPDGLCFLQEVRTRLTAPLSGGRGPDASQRGHSSHAASGAGTLRGA